MDVRDQDAAELLSALLDELRALQEETVRQSALLEEVVRKLAEIERSQSS
jgi:hypothetical protein